jgi:AhpD family alkylhydroperoxidase
MAHIELLGGLPGIRALFAFRPETAKPLCELAEVLLHMPSTLSMAEGELTATYVSSQNNCCFCQTAHGALTAYHLEGNENLVLDVKRDFESTAISEKLKTLLAIAGKVQHSGKDVLPGDVEHALKLGATDPGNS